MKDSTILDGLLAHEMFSQKQRSNRRSKSTRAPLNQRLFDVLRSAILAGNVKPGQKLPSTRELMAELGISRNTILYVFNRLADEGYTTTEIGSGTYVSNTMPDPAMLKKIADLTKPNQNARQ